MDRRLINLQLVLQELGLDPNIDTLDERVTFQKAIYLAQVAGVPLHYMYSWYRMGPYSPDLTRDYYALHEYSDDDMSVTTDLKIKEPFVSILRDLRPAMDAPEDVDLQQRDWLELLSSVHFLRLNAKLDAGATQQRLQLEKSSLSHYASRATQVLLDLKLI